MTSLEHVLIVGIKCQRTIDSFTQLEEDEGGLPLTKDKHLDKRIFCITIGYYSQLPIYPALAKPSVILWRKVLISI